MALTQAVVTSIAPIRSEYAAIKPSESPNNRICGRTLANRSRIYFTLTGFSTLPVSVVLWTLTVSAIVKLAESIPVPSP